MSPNLLPYTCKSRGVELADVLSIYKAVHEGINRLMNHGDIAFDASLLMTRLKHVIREYNAN